MTLDRRVRFSCCSRLARTGEIQFSTDVEPGKVAVGPIIEHVAAMIASGAGLSKQPTLLTQRSRSAGRGRRKAPKPPTTSRHIEAHGDEAVPVPCGYRRQDQPESLRSSPAPEDRAGASEGTGPTPQHLNSVGTSFRGDCPARAREEACPCLCGCTPRLYGRLIRRDRARFTLGGPEPEPEFD